MATLLDVLFPITTVALIACIGWTYRFDNRRSALRMGLWVWAFGLALTAIPALSYDVTYSRRVDAFIAASLAATTVGYRLVRKPLAQQTANYPDQSKQRLVFQWVSALGIIGGVLLLVDATLGGTELNFSYLTTNLPSIRADAFDPTRNPHTKLFVPGFLLMSFSYVSVLASVKLGRAGGPLLLWMGIANFVLIAAVSLFVFAGRTVLFNAVFLLLAGAWISGRRFNVMRPRTLLVLAMIVVAGWYFATTFTTSREGGGIPIDRYLTQLERAKMSPDIAPLAYKNPAVASAVLNFGYFSSPLPTLTWYVASGPLPGPYHGANSYPLAVLFLNRVTPTTPYADLRREVYSPLEASGYEGNVWATWLRDLLVDFGYAGTIAFLLLFGAFMAWARNWRERTGAVHYHVLEVIASVTFAFGVFQNQLLVNVYSGSFFAALATMFAIRVHVRHTSPAVQRAQRLAPRS